jgi:hypothetical protein
MTVHSIIARGETGPLPPNDHTQLEGIPPWPLL